MSIHDYLTGTDLEFEARPNPLAAADMDLSEAYANAERRNRRNEIQDKINKLMAQKKELQDRLKSLRAHSLSRMSEDEVVALAKSRGIRDQDIEAWLRGRIARTNREISEGQKEELGKQAEAEAQKAAAIDNANKQARKKAILEARNAYETANKPVETEEIESKVSELDSLEFTFNNLKDSYEEDYNEKLDYTLTPRKVQSNSADGEPKTEIPDIPADVKLTKDQLRVWNNPTTSTDLRNKIIAQIRDKMEAKGEEEERKRKAREDQLDGIKKDLDIIGIYDAAGLARYVKNFNKSDDRNDKVKAGAVARIDSFVGSDKEFKDYPSLKSLFPESTKK